MPATVQKALDLLDELSLTDRQYVIDVERQRIIEERRKEIHAHSLDTEDDLKAGKLKAYENVSDLIKALNE